MSEITLKIIANQSSIMSCKNCENNSVQTYYRWKNTNIEMHGCIQHLREVMDALNEYQSGDEAMIDNDKPTIERIDRPDPYDRHSDNMVSLDVPEVAAVLIEMFEQQTEILEALADAGLINLDNNES